MIKNIFRLFGLIAFSFLIIYNINLINPVKANNNLSLIALASAIADTCEAEDGSGECICKGECYSDEDSCACL